ncbi:LAMI_0B09076g1_1 [Lachancea mirantina]|uniref:LAMI_0B09076g1_1 n=1 Tax=Lachancea mirantina TaxID=1230905 RepID=A0A1G4IY63_9SACH|nr:LAMI_0B09076g1_1 [Lachancea mirantina]
MESSTNVNLSDQHTDVSSRNPYQEETARLKTSRSFSNLAVNSDSGNKLKLKATINKGLKTRASSKHQMAACCFCKKRRKKCDGGFPTCGGCKQNNIQCTVIDIPTGREIPRNYLDVLETKIELLEKELGGASKLIETLSKSQESIDGLSESNRIADRIEDQKHFGADRDKGLPLEVGYITLTAAGEPRYIGASSAFSIARAIHSTIRCYGQQKTPHDSSIYPEADGLSLNRTPKMVEAVFQKPSFEDGRYLLKAYRYGVQFQYPFLDWQWVTSCFKNVMKDDSEEDEPLFFVYMIFAIGSQLLDHSSSTFSDNHTKAFYDKAFDHIGSIVKETTVRAVQAYLLLSVFSQKMPYGSSIWQTTGLAVRTSVALGLHRKPYVRNKSDFSKNDWPEQDLKCRIFWCAYSMERINGLILGRPFGISDADIDVPIPQSSEYEVAAHVFKLRMLQSTICSFVYKPRPYAASLEDTNATRHEILLELNEWKSTFPHKKRAKSTWETENWCTISYHNSILLLLRPVVLEVAELKEKMPPITAKWFGIFAQSASAICLNYKQLHSKQKMSYTWLAIQCVFVSGLSFLYCMWLNSSSSLNLLKWARGSIIYDTISACSNILYVLAERWSEAQIFRDSFERMSKAVLSHIEKTNGDESHVTSDELSSQSQTCGSALETGVSLNSDQTKISYEIDINQTCRRQNQGLTDGLSFANPQNSSAGSSPEMVSMAIAGIVDRSYDGEAVWDFISNTEDNFVKDMFYDLETAFEI